MRQICAEAEAYLKSNRRPAHTASGSLSELVDPITEATVDAACLATERLDAPLVVVATDSGRSALALSNRRPAATVLALTQTLQVARILAMCWGVIPVVVSEASRVEHELTLAIDWARSQGLLQAGQRVVLLRGAMPGPVDTRAVLVREVR
jgi:pyruvate kinase